MQEQTTPQADFVETGKLRARRLAEKAQSLRTSESILASVEKAMLNQNSPLFDLTKVHAAANNFALAIKERNQEMATESEQAFSSEYDKWREAVITRDAQITPRELRQYFEKFNQASNAIVFEALARFYHALPPSEATQSKYDLAITSLFAKNKGKDNRELNVSREELCEKLKELFAKWSLPESAPEFDNSDVYFVVRKIRSFVLEIGDIASLEEMIARDVTNRIRSLKREVGELFYAAEVTAAFIECNIIVGNRFADLVAEDSANNSHLQDSELDFGELFRESSSKTVLQIEAVLHRLQEGNDADGENVARLKRLIGLLQFSEDADFIVASARAKDAAHETTQEMSGLVAQLQQLSERADEELSREIGSFHWSPEVATLDLRMFLTPLGEMEESAETDCELTNLFELRREALLLILRADKLHTDLSAELPLNTEIEAELTSLLTKMQACGSQLSQMMPDSLASDKRSEALLYVSNHLMRARLRLQTAIVRRSANEIAQHEAVRQNAPAAAQEKSVRAVESTNAKSSSRKLPSMRLVAAAAILLAISIGVSFFSTGNTSFAQRDQSVHVLDSKTVPNGDYLTSARVNKEIFFATVNEKWNKLDETEKRQKIMTWLEYARQQNVNNIMLTDQEGNPRGNVVKGEILLEN